MEQREVHGQEERETSYVPISTGVQQPSYTSEPSNALQHVANRAIESSTMASQHTVYEQFIKLAPSSFMGSIRPSEAKE
ncbi:hypothetical protein [Bartonella sp. AC134YNZD]|uniref:hypothetical protein n=1 Tax=Bartonella sp. AC134YNZD TaxID=3243446 RepID=UPI0035CFAA9F